MAALVGLVSESWRLHGLHNHLHIGDVYWFLGTQREESPEQPYSNIRLWTDGGNTVGFAWLEGDDTGDMLVHPDHRHIGIEEEMLKWIEERHRASVQPLRGETSVQMAFSALGFTKTDGEGLVDAVLYEQELAVAFVEIEGTKGQTGVRKYRQLRQYIDDDYLSGNAKKKGIVVANAFLEKPPEERGEQFSTELVRGAEGLGYCLLSTTELIKLVQRALENPSGLNKRKLRDDLLNHTGVYITTS